MFPTSKRKGTKGVYYVHYSLEIFTEYINTNTTGMLSGQNFCRVLFYEIQPSGNDETFLQSTSKFGNKR